MQELKKTCLYQNHLDLNAKMVDFAGWSMPLHYQSQLVEHNAVRSNAGIFDVSHMKVIDITGDQVIDFLSYLLANDIRKISPNQAIYSAMLNEHAGVIDDLITYLIKQNFARLIVNAGCYEKDIQWIIEQSKKFAVEIETRNDLATIALQGAKSWQYLKQFCQQFIPQSINTINQLNNFAFFVQADIFIAKTGYTGEAGFELILPTPKALIFWQKMIELAVQPCGLASRDSLRLEAGYPLYGNELDENHTPLVSGLSWCTKISDDRDFIGKKALIAQKTKGIEQKLVGLILMDKAMLRKEQKVIFANNNKTGLITSGGYCHLLKKSIALARIPILNSKDLYCWVQIRDKKLKAQISQAYFVRNAQLLVEAKLN